MNFEDPEITNLDLETPDDITRLITKYLCGESYYPQSSEEDKELLLNLMNNAKQKGLNYRQFNELLLLLNQDKIGKDFFKFFFKKDQISLDDLKKSIIRFRGFAMLCFGNFRFAYKQLILMSEDELKEKLSPCWKAPTELIREFKMRPDKMLEIEKIERDKTWYLGEISGNKFNKDVELLEKEKAKKAEADSV